MVVKMTTSIAFIYHNHKVYFYFSLPSLAILVLNGVFYYSKGKDCKILSLKMVYSLKICWNMKQITPTEGIVYLDFSENSPSEEYSVPCKTISTS